MNQSYSTIERLLETGDGCISRKAAIANGVAPASFARYVRSHGLSDMLPPLIEVGASRSRILLNPVSTSYPAMSLPLIYQVLCLGY